MPQYRAFPCKGSHIVAAPHIIICATDQQAIEKAKQFVDGYDIEIWDGKRFIAEIKSADQK